MTEQLDGERTSAAGVEGLSGENRRKKNTTKAQPGFQNRIQTNRKTCTATFFLTGKTHVETLGHNTTACDFN